MEDSQLEPLVAGCFQAEPGEVHKGRGRERVSLNLAGREFGAGINWLRSLAIAIIVLEMYDFLTGW